MSESAKKFLIIVVIFVAILSPALIGAYFISQNHSGVSQNHSGVRLGPQLAHPYTKYSIGGHFRIYEFSPEFDPSLTCIVKGTGSSAVNCYSTESIGD